MRVANDLRGWIRLPFFFGASVRLKLGVNAGLVIW